MLSRCGYNRNSWTIHSKSNTHLYFLVIITQEYGSFKKIIKIVNNRKLTLLEPAGFGDFRKKNSSFWLPYQRPSSSADWARELFNGSNGSASLVDCTRKNFSCLGVAVFFVSDVISGGLLGHLGPLCLALGANR